MNIALSGFLLGLSLIVAIGPQNALIIKQGIKRQGIGPIITVCMLSDIVLMIGGTAGVGAIVSQAPMVLVIMRWLGAAYLAWFGYQCFRDSFAKDAKALVVDEQEPVGQPLAGGTSAVAVDTRKATAVQHKAWVKPVMMALAFTWLNPAAWIDTLVMVGGLANQHGEVGRWYFVGGALVASMMWFPSVGYGAAALSGVLSRPKVWKVINFAIGCIMVSMCLRLIFQ
ncbi:LysE/ArgO family amino acid transporter [Corynebacterium vitaeruminis]|uniref:LysE/ArgO family amino acid transporter n=1 Tax=Corynebacterium vitaeruminis TaxID=38305 RepID=UPI0005518003|nr:LysE family transporter [Corynebacterium vitaeruminis]